MEVNIGDVVLWKDMILKITYDDMTWCGETVYNEDIKRMATDEEAMSIGVYREHFKLDTEELKAIDSMNEYLKSIGFSIAKINVEFYTRDIEYVKWENVRLEFFGASQKKIEVERNHMAKEIQKNA